MYMFSYCREALLVYAISDGPSIKQTDTHTKEIIELKNSKEDKETASNPKRSEKYWRKVRRSYYIKITYYIIPPGSANLIFFAFSDYILTTIL